MSKITDINAAYDPQFVKVDTPKQVSQLRRELAEAQAEITRLKGEAESWEKVFDRTCEHLADAKSELAEAITKERERCAKVCEERGSFNSMYAHHILTGAAAAIRKGE